MADVWLPGAHRDPGRNAGYNSGRSQMRRAVAHYTVGSDSRNVGRDGYFHFLVHRDASREGGCTQYAEVDAVTWHAADPGNPYGPGVEWERLVTGGLNAEGLSEAQPLTANQIEWGARLVDFFAEWNIPAALYDGPRYGQADWAGWVNHQAIDSSRSDGLTRAEWNALTGPTSAPAPATPKGTKLMWMVIQGWLTPDYVEVYYMGVLVEGFQNLDTNVFGVGPKLQGYMDQGVPYTRYEHEADWQGTLRRLETTHS